MPATTAALNPSFEARDRRRRLHRGRRRQRRHLRRPRPGRHHRRQLDLFGLTTADAAARRRRPDLRRRRHASDRAQRRRRRTTRQRHARDADVIVGDNGNIYRLVAAAGGRSLSVQLRQRRRRPTTARHQSAICRPRASTATLDYTPGGPDYNAAAGDRPRRRRRDPRRVGRRLRLRHEAATTCSSATARTTTSIGGWGNDWISGGTGDDGVLGDDGRIFISRNGTAEPLYGIAARPDRRRDDHRRRARSQVATINVDRRLRRRST